MERRKPVANDGARTPGLELRITAKLEPPAKTARAEAECHRSTPLIPNEITKNHGKARAETPPSLASALFSLICERNSLSHMTP